jgi:heme-degrading monooxygenase HmoA
MIVTVFRARARTDLDPQTLEKLGQVGQRMVELVQTMPGFIAYRDYAAPDGESVTIAEFETMEDTLRWRNHPEHLAAQDFGRSRVFSAYRVQVCEQIRESRQP